MADSVVDSGASVVLVASVVDEASALLVEEDAALEVEDTLAEDEVSVDSSSSSIGSPVQPWPGTAMS